MVSAIIVEKYSTYARFGNHLDCYTINIYVTETIKDLQPSVACILETQAGELLIHSHLPPLSRLEVQDPCILQSIAILIHSTSDQQLGVLFSIVEAAGSMRVSTHWPRGPPGPL